MKKQNESHDELPEVYVPGTLTDWGKKIGASIAEIAKRSFVHGFDVSPHTLYRYENNDSSPTFDWWNKFRRIAPAIKADVEKGKADSEESAEPTKRIMRSRANGRAKKMNPFSPSTRRFRQGRIRLNQFIGSQPIAA